MKFIFRLLSVCFLAPLSSCWVATHIPLAVQPQVCRDSGQHMVAGQLGLIGTTGSTVLFSAIQYGTMPVKGLLVQAHLAGMETGKGGREETTTQGFSISGSGGVYQHSLSVGHLHNVRHGALGISGGFAQDFVRFSQGYDSAGMRVSTGRRYTLQQPFVQAFAIYDFKSRWMDPGTSLMLTYRASWTHVAYLRNQGSYTAEQAHFLKLDRLLHTIGLSFQYADAYTHWVAYVTAHLLLSPAMNSYLAPGFGYTVGLGYRFQPKPAKALPTAP